MKEKKQFFIPRNYDKKFEGIPGISGLQHIAFIPVIAADFYIMGYSHFDFSNKIVISSVLFGLPWTMIATHPIRENVSLYKHLLWKFKFLNRQRKFKYRKEGYEYVQQTNESNQSGKAGSKAKARKEQRDVSPGADTVEGRRERDADNTRQSHGPISKSVGH